eukprot:UN04150
MQSLSQLFRRPSKQIYLKIKSLNRLLSTFHCYPLQCTGIKYKHSIRNNKQTISKYTKRSFTSASASPKTILPENDFYEFENFNDYEQFENINDYDSTDFVWATTGVVVFGIGALYIYDKKISKHTEIPDAYFYMS